MAEQRHDFVFIGVPSAAAAVAGALLGVLIERGILTPPDLDLVLERARELAAPECSTLAGSGADVIDLMSWPLKR